MGTLELVKSILNGEKIQDEEIEKGLRTVIVPPSNGKKGYQYQRNFPENKRENNTFQAKHNNETEDEKIKRYIYENSKRLTDKKFLDLSKRQVKKLIRQLRSCHYYDKEGIHVAYGRDDKLEERTNSKEMKGAKLLRDLGIEVFLLPDLFAYGKNGSEKRTFGDAIALHKNHIMDFKQVDGENAGKNYLKALEQGHDCLLYITNSNMTLKRVKDQIKWEYTQRHIPKGRLGMKSDVIVFLENTQDTYLLKIDKTGNIKEVDLSVYKASRTKVMGKSTFSLNNTLTDIILHQNKIMSTNTVNKSIKNTEVEINIKDVTVGNRQAKIDCLEKSFTDKLNYGKALVEYVEKDDTPVLKDLITLRIARFDKGKIDKAVRTLSFSLDTELKAPKGEAFTYKAQEDLTNLFVKELTEKTKELYTMLVAYFGLPEMRILAKANLIYKGKVVYSPETGKPISEKDWAKFVDALEKFLNRNYKGIGKRIVLSADVLGRILDRLTDTKKLEEIKKLRLDELKYKGKKLEWISDSVKNMADTFGESLSRTQQAKIQVMTQSAAQRVTNVTDKMRGDIQQILIDGVKNHQSKSQVSQALFDKCVGLNRDFQRIADTEIHNAATEAYINEEVYKTPEGKKVYFKRFEILDDNTCKKCSSINGMIALYSDTPLSSQKIVDEYAEIAIWEGCGILNDKEIPMSGCHPYCRGAWIRYYPETEKEVKEMMQ